MRNTFDGRGPMRGNQDSERRGVAGFLGELWRLVSTLSAGVAWGILPVVLLGWLEAISLYGSPRLESLLGLLYEPLMLLAYPALLFSVVALAIVGVWVASGFGSRRGAWTRSTTVALLVLALPAGAAVALVGASMTLGFLAPALSLLALGGAYSATAVVAACLVLPGVIVTATRLWSRWRWAPPVWLLVWGGMLWLSRTRVDFTWLPTLPVLLIASAAATVVMIAVAPSTPAAGSGTAVQAGGSTQ